MTRQYTALIGTAGRVLYGIGIVAIGLGGYTASMGFVLLILGAWAGWPDVDKDIS